MTVQQRDCILPTVGFIPSLCMDQVLDLGLFDDHDYDDDEYHDEMADLGWCDDDEDDANCRYIDEMSELDEMEPQIISWDWRFHDDIRPLIYITEDSVHLN